jgi:hypothetical protein
MTIWWHWSLTVNSVEGGCMDKSILIPIPLLEKTIELLHCVNTHYYDLNFCQEFHALLWELEREVQHTQLREAFNRWILTNDQNDRDAARIQYLKLKQDFECPF